MSKKEESKILIIASGNEKNPINGNLKFFDKEPERLSVDESKPFDVRYPWQLRYNKFIDNPQLAIYETGWQHCSPKYSYGPAKWGYYIMHFIESGRGVVKVNGKTYKVSRNQIVLIPPETLATFTADVELPWRYMWIGFNGLQANWIVKKMGYEDGLYVKDFSEPDKLFSLFNHIIDYNTHSEIENMAMVGYLYVLFSEMCKNTKEVVNSNKNEHENCVDGALHYINENYSMPITIKDVAEYVGFDRSYFFKKFKGKIGISPKEYLINQRMCKARSLMKDSKFSCYEICKMVGYDDYANFSKTFKKKYGVNPSEYMEHPFEADALDDKG